MRVAEAPPHPEAFDIAKKLNVDTVTNATVRKKLGLSAIGESISIFLLQKRSGNTFGNIQCQLRHTEQRTFQIHSFRKSPSSY